MRIESKIFLCATLLVLGGCQTTRSPDSLQQNKPETFSDVSTAVGSVVEAISGTSMTEEEKKKFLKKLNKDDEAKTAIQSLSTYADPNKVVVKYCPKTGKRYAARINYCPEHKVELQIVEE